MTDTILNTIDSGLRYTVFNTSQGWIGCLSSRVGLKKTTLPQSSPQRAIEMLGVTAEQAIWSPDSFADIIHSLTGYFSGKQSEFPCALDFGQATPFQRQVCEATRAI